MEKSRKTTISVDVETSEAIDRYCKERGILKMDFVRKAFHAIQELGIDIDSETLYMVEKEENKQGVALQPKADDSLQQFNASLACIAQNMGVLTQALLTMPERERTAEQAALNIHATAVNDRIIELKNELFRLRNDNKQAKERIDQLLISIEKLKGHLSIAIDELQRSGLFKKPNKAILDRLILELKRVSESPKNETTTTIYFQGNFRSV